MDIIHAAIARGDLPKIRALVKEEPDLLYLDDWQARTPLVLSVLANHIELVAFFVEEGQAEVDEQTAPDENTALFYACRDGRPEIVKYLLAHGADPAQQNRNGTTMFMITVASSPNCLESLLKLHPLSPSTLLRVHEYIHVLYHLIDATVLRYGPAGLYDLVNLSRASTNHQTALCMARDWKHMDLLPVLAAAGAHPFVALPTHTRTDTDPHTPSPPQFRSNGSCGSLSADTTKKVKGIAKDPQRVYLLEKVRCVCEGVHALEKVKEKENEKKKEGKEESDEDKMKKRLAAVPSVLWPRVRGEEGLPRVSVSVCVDGELGVSGGCMATAAAVVDDEKKKEDEEEKQQIQQKQEKLQAVLVHVVNGDGLKPELFIELMAMMEHFWYSQMWEVEECNDLVK